MTKRLPGLDLLRALAIIWVLFFHAGTLSLGSPAPALTSFGWMGVDLFFVLSGFLIGRQWLAGSMGFREFYSRRALRILPKQHGVLAIVSYGGIALAFGLAFHFAVERPFLALRRRDDRVPQGMSAPADTRA